VQQQLLNAISIGSIYALFAVGYTLVFGVMDILNLAHSAVFMLGAALTYSLVVNHGQPFWVACVLGIAASGFMGLVIEHVCLRPLRRRKAPPIAALISTIGLALIIVAVIAAPVGWHLLKPFQKERVLIFLNPERDPLGSGYQLTQAKIATGSGGIRGKGFMRGTQVNLQYLPASHTDFIFSVLGEEWGFVGVSIVLTLYLYLIVQALLIAEKSRDRGGAFLVLGLISFFVFHTVINVSMQIGLLPVTGIPLPLLSYGGSATMMFLMSVGLILNVAMRRFVNA